MTINDRLKEIRKSTNLSQREFSKRIFFSQTMYSDIENGNVPIKERLLRLISSQFNVNLDWIKTGNGEMFSSPPPDYRLESLIEVFNQFSPELQDLIFDHLKRLLKVQKGTLE